jgi:non-specific serine/threonine protein kinase/serine/threonine-protein kinase
MNEQARWARMWELFHGAAELPADARHTWLDGECAGDEGLRHEVLQMRLSHDAADDFLEPAVAAPPGSPRGVATGDRVGPWLVGTHLGEGGFADVWAAEQHEPVQRRAALKVLKPGMDSRAVLTRFAAERDTLARLQHPGIATVLDAGSTADGRPWFAMELVDGAPLTKFCDGRRLDLADRLRLLRQVCDAVQHAHQKAVLHRDLKPSNILVADADGAPRVKVIDFGIAKVLGNDPGGQRTQTGQLVGTPDYMSPEQLAGDDLDTRSDVYSLGVVAYELLAGVRPFQRQRRDGGRRLEDLVLAGELPRPSTQPDTTRHAHELAQQRRCATPRVHAQRLRGELDWIVMKALERERERRYRSPAELGADIERLLRHEPVLAGPPTTAYRLRKLVRRHPAAAAAAAMLLVALIGFAVHWKVTADAERTLRHDAVAGQTAAQQNLRIADKVNEFFAREVLAASDPRRTADQAITVREALDAAAAKAGEQFANEPLLEAAVRQTIGETYRSLGELALAVPQADRAVELFERTLGRDDTRTLRAVSMQATLYGRVGRFEEAVASCRRAHEARVATLGPDDPETLRCAVNLAAAQAAAGRAADGEQLLRATIASLERVAGADHADTAMAIHHLGSLLSRAGKPTDAEPLLARAVALHRRTLEPDHPTTLAALGERAAVLTQIGRAEEAAAMHEEVAAGMQRRLGDDHLETIAARMNLAWSWVQGGRFADAEPVMLDGAARTRRLLGDDHKQSLAAENHVGSMYAQWRREADAEPHYAFAADGARKLMPETEWLRGMYLMNHARSLNRTNRPADALPRMREAFAIIHKALGSHPKAIEALIELAIIEDSNGNTEEGARLRARLKPRPEPAK